MNKEIILLKALEIISNDGIEKLTLSYLAKSIQLTKATLYNYFSNKEEIIESAFLYGHKALLKDGLNLNLKGTTEEILSSLSSLWLGLFENEENFYFLRSVFSLHLTNDSAEEEYNTIISLIKSQSEVVVAQMSIKNEFEEIVSKLLSSYLLNQIIRIINDEDLELEYENKRLSLLIDYLKCR